MVFVVRDTHDALMCGVELCQPARPHTVLNVVVGQPGCAHTQLSLLFLLLDAPGSVQHQLSQLPVVLGSHSVCSQC